VKLLGQMFIKTNSNKYVKVLRDKAMWKIKSELASTRYIIEDTF